MDKSGWVVGRVLAAQAAARPDEVFLEPLGAWSLTFGEADALASRVARALAKLGVAPGHHVGVMLPNGHDYCAVWFGLSRASAVHVAVNTGLVGAFLAHVLGDSQCAVLICDVEHLARLVEIEASLPALRRVLVRGLGAERDGRPRFARVEVTPLDVLFAERNEGDDDDGPPLPEPSYRDVGCIMYTSGTTGPAKGVLMPHAHMYLLGLGAVENLGLTSSDAYYVCLPLFHANAMFMQLYACLIAGARAVIAPRFRATTWLDDIRKHRCTVTNTIGVMSEFVLRQPARPDDRLTALRLVLAVPTPPALATAFLDRFGARMVEGYGMTEVNMPIYAPVDAPRAGSCGKEYSRFFEVRVLDPETDEEVAAGEVGEIAVRPKEPFAFSLGYHGMPARTVEAFRNFFFHTGDAGRKDADGYLYFVDRIKDCIRRRGENISSFEIERVLTAHSSVLEAAAVAVASEVPGGEDEVKACVVLRAGASAEPRELAAFCEGRMPAFAVPRYVEILSALPKTPTEKVQKRRLRDAGITRTTWDREAR